MFCVEREEEVQWLSDLSFSVWLLLVAFFTKVVEMGGSDCCHDIVEGEAFALKQGVDASGQAYKVVEGIVFAVFSKFCS